MHGTVHEYRCIGYAEVEPTVKKREGGGTQFYCIHNYLL